MTTLIAFQNDLLNIAKTRDLIEEHLNEALERGDEILPWSRWFAAANKRFEEAENALTTMELCEMDAACDAARLFGRLVAHSEQDLRAIMAHRREAEERV